MKTIVPTIVAATMAAGVGVAVAAPATQGSATASPAAGRSRMADVGAVIREARVAGMKAVLKLTPDQEKYWVPFQSALRDAYALRNREMMQLHKAIGKDNPVQLLDMLSDAATRGAAQMKKVADAAKPLYESLSPMQKRAFGPLLLSLRRNPMTTATQARLLQRRLMRRWAQSAANPGG